MGMACSSEVRAAAAIAEDVGFDSLPCPPFSDSFRNWCPHHYWAYDNLVKYFLKITGGYSGFFAQCTALVDIKSAGDEDSLIRLNKY